MHASNLNLTLVPVGIICDKKRLVDFTENEVVLLDVFNFSIFRDNISAITKRNIHSGLYELNSDHCGLTGVQTKYIPKPKKKSSIIWHKRLVHVNKNVLKSTHKYANGVP